MLEHLTVFLWDMFQLGFFFSQKIYHIVHDFSLNYVIVLVSVYYNPGVETAMIKTDVFFPVIQLYHQL